MTTIYECDSCGHKNATNFAGHNSEGITLYSDGLIKRGTPSTGGPGIARLVGNGHGQYAVCAIGSAFEAGVSIGSRQHDPEAVCAALRTLLAP